MQRTIEVLFIITIALSFSHTAQADKTSPKFGMQPSYGHLNQNLFDEVMVRKNQLAWDRQNGDTLPSGLCDALFSNCLNKKLPFKILAYPLEVPGREEQGALVLSWTVDQDHPDIVMLASVTEGDATFFLLSNEGTLLKTAYRTKTGTWVSLSNSVARDHFERERNQWHKWLVSLDGSYIGPTP
jgi:hypothetical protein